MFMIGFVWCFSALVSLPPLLGWKGKEAEGQCTLSEDLGYVLYSANGSFFIPALVMVFVYARIFVAARSRARRNIKKKKLPAAPSEITSADPAKDKSTTTCTSLSNPSPPNNDQKQVNSEDDDETSGSVKGVSVISAPDTSPRPPPILVTPQSRSYHDNGSSHHQPMSPSALISTPEIIVEATPTPHSSPTKSCDKKLSSEDKCVSFQTPSSPFRPRLQLESSSETRFGSEDIEETPSQESPVTRNPPSATRGFLTPTSALSRFKASPYGSTLSIADFDDSDLGTEPESDQNKRGKNLTTPGGRVVISAPRLATSEAERHKRKVAKARERRATFILGLIMASFIGAWLPFFTMYLIQGICKECTISPGVFTFAFWLGYCNSAINPIIYTVFNRDFRKAFRKILFRWSFLPPILLRLSSSYGFMSTATKLGFIVSKKSMCCVHRDSYLSWHQRRKTSISFTGWWGNMKTAPTTEADTHYVHDDDEEDGWWPL